MMVSLFPSRPNRRPDLTGDTTGRGRPGIQPKNPSSSRRHPLRLLVLDPVARFRHEDEAAVVAEVDAGLGHLAAEEAVFLAPEQQGGHADAGGGGGLRLGAQGGAVPVDHGADLAGLGPGLAIEGEVGVAEGARTAGALERLDATGEIIFPEGMLGQPGELEEEDVGALLPLRGVLADGPLHHQRGAGC